MLVGAADSHQNVAGYTGFTPKTGPEPPSVQGIKTCSQINKFGYHGKAKSSYKAKRVTSNDLGLKTRAFLQAAATAYTTAAKAGGWTPLFLQLPRSNSEPSATA